MLLKLLTLLLLTPWLCAANAQSLPSSNIDLFLSQVLKNSIEIKIAKSESKLNIISAKLEETQFATHGYMSLASSKSKNPATSPFAAERRDSNQFGLGIGKTWQTGFKTSLDYALANDSIFFPSRSNLSYHFPQLTASIETSIFRDLAGGKFASFNERIEQQIIRAKRESENTIKNILVGALLQLVEIIELQEEITLQKKLCSQISKQSKKLRKKLSRKSIAERDWLLSKKNENICVANLQGQNKRLKEKNNKIETSYAVSPELYRRWRVSAVFNQLSKLSTPLDPAQFNPTMTGELLSIDASVKSLKAKQQQLDADIQPDLALKLSTGLSGIDDKFPMANEDIFQTRYPNISLSMQLNFPVENSTNIAKAESNRIQTENQLRLYQLKKRESLSRVSVLKQAIADDLKIYKRYEENIRLSHRILDQATHDFDLGRINYNTLSEFQKGVTLSRQQAASLRIRIIVQTVEYVDYFGFFNGYLR